MPIPLDLALYPGFENILMFQPQLYNHLLAEITMDLLHDQVFTQDDLDCQLHNESSE